MNFASLRGLGSAGALACALLGGEALAGPCEPSVNLSGDPELVSQVGHLLERQGVALHGSNDCPVVQIELQRRAHVIAIVRTSEPPEERIVAEAATAAILIESWSRNDFEHPLLSSHVVDVVPPPAPAPIVVVMPKAPPADESATRDAYEPPPGIQVFAAAETSIADDRTSWAGAVVGVCVQVGRICASARGRVATVIDGPGVWDRAERHTADVLIGTDVPFSVHGTTFSFGIGAGMGSVHTGAMALGMPSGNETSGLRGDAHLAWSVSLAHRVSLDLSVAVDLAQVGDVEGTLSSEVTKEPYLFGRVGAGLRYGGP